MDKLAEKAISNINKGKDKKNDSVLMMASFANWDRFLTPAPSAIAILGELLLISTQTDFTLRENMPPNGFQYIKYPDSFRACLVQVSNSGWNAFNEAHTSMDQIRLTSGNVDTHVKEAVRILMGGSPKEVEKILPLTLKNIEQIAEDSLELAQNIEQKFLFVMHLTEELLEASTNTKSVYDRKLKETKTQIEVAEIEKQRAEEAKKERQKRYENMVKQVNQAQEDYTQAVKDIPGSASLLGLSLAEGLVDFVKSIIGLPGDIVRGLGFGSYNIAQEWISRKPKHATPDSASVKPLNVRLAEHYVLSIVAQIDAYIQALAGIIGNPGKQIDTNAIKEGVGVIRASLVRSQANVSAEKDSGKIGLRVSKVCKKGIEICDDAKSISDAMCTNKTTQDVQKRLDELRCESMELVAKANKKLGRNPLDEKSPCLQDVPVQSGNPNVVKTAVEKSRFKTELAKETLKDAKERQDAADTQLEQANERLCDVLKTMKNLKIEQIDFETVRKTLQDGITALAQVKAQWGKLVVLFEEIANIIKCCMCTSLKKFVQTATVGRELKNQNDEIMSKAFRANMYEQTLHASRVSYVVSTMAGAYVAISRDHLMDQITQLAELIGLDPEANKHQIVLERQRLHEACEKAQKAIKGKIKEQHKKYEAEIDGRISRIKREVEALMPPPDCLPAIQQAVHKGISDAEVDDLVE